MENFGTNTFIYGLALAVVVSYVLRGTKSDTAIPALVGSKGVISRFFPSLYFFIHGKDVLDHACAKDGDGFFRVPIFFQDWYATRDRKHIQEIASAPEHVLSFIAAIEPMSYIIGKNLLFNPYHAHVVRGTLTRNLDRCFPEVRDEIVHSFEDVLALKDNEWNLVQVQPAILQIVARTSNCLFVGIPLCREQEYLQTNINFAVSVFSRGQLVSVLPKYLQPIFGPLLSKRNSSLKKVLKFLGPLIDERLEKENQYGKDWPGRPNDLISWLIDVAEGEERTTPALAMRILAVNFGAIHTSTMTLTAALYDLTTHPAYIGPMREEVKRVIAQEGWSKAALGSMHKIDSFLRESQRFSGALGSFSLVRKVIANDGFTFSDGTTLPHGATVFVPLNVVHHDSEIHSQPNVFDGFRFLRMRTDDIASVGRSRGERDDSVLTVTRQMVSTSPEHLVFGHGRHACPGRFFAATELKAMLAHILIEYDIRAEIEGVRPPDKVFGMVGIPDPVGKIWIKKRA